MRKQPAGLPIDILLVEDNAADARLTREGLKQAGIVNALHVAEDGDQALDYLYRRNGFGSEPRPNLILLDLNLPGTDGRTVLRTIKQDKNLRSIPVVVLSVSEAEADIAQSYESHANCYIPKPIEFDGFLAAVRAVEDFWFTVVRLP